MRNFLFAVLTTPLALALASPAAAETFAGSSYTAGELLKPCQEADNDSREGAVAEMECEQYIMGYMDAMAKAGALGAAGGACPPDVNTADEVRWAFMRWVHDDYAGRTGIPASTALLETLKAGFPCE